MVNFKIKYKKLKTWGLNNKDLDSNEKLQRYIEIVKEQKLVNLWFIVSSTLASLSFAFFIGLLSIKPNEISSSLSLTITMILLSISLFLNSYLTVIFFGIKSHPSENDEDVLYTSMSTNIMRFIHTSSFLILPAGIATLILYFSTTVFFISTTLLFVFIYIWSKVDESVKSKGIFK
ncbi:hypothetical protein [Morganella morganii]|uniref:hypothetical protein n=1 Tax=Morganella morganii TaxID=582 RepID=UPI003EBE8E6C